MRHIYNVLFYCALPIVILRLLWRARKNPAYAKRWRERFGLVSIPQASGGLWIHAVSVGETLAAVPLVKTIKRQFPTLPIIVTTTTPTGSAQVHSHLQKEVFHVYAPYDLPSAVQRFLRHLKPKALLLMETELWPNLLHMCHEQGVPVMLANARLSERSAAGYQRFQPLVRRMLKQLAVVAAQSKADAERFVQLGLDPARIAITGNIKFDIEIPASLTQDAQILRQQWGVQRPVLIAASTHGGEDEIILQAFSEILKKIPDALLILVPRHPERFPAVAQLCRKQGFNICLRSEGIPSTTATQIFIGDTIGELKLFYAAADIAFVGGSFVPTGGHNLLEPAILKLPVLSGPHTFNFAEITELLLKAGALVQVNDATQLTEQVLALMQNDEQRQQMGLAGYHCVEQNRGSLQKHLQLLNQLSPLP